MEEFFVVKRHEDRRVIINRAPGERPQQPLTSLREKAVDIGVKRVSHSRHAMPQAAEVAVPRELFGRILDRIARLRPPDRPPC